MTSYLAKMPLLRRQIPREMPASSHQAEVATAVSQPAVNRLQVLEHPLAQHALTVLRNKQTPPHQFRMVSNQLLMLLMIEATRILPARKHTVETAAGSHAGQVLAKPVVFIAIARHGLGLAHSVADMFPDLHVGAISLDRSSDGQLIEPRLHLANAPALGDACVILFDPVVASGGSAHAALKLVRRSGATDVSLISFLFSLPGLSRLQSSFPEAPVWTAGIDDELDPKRGPLPGLGNFANRLYG